ncbi:MAG: GTP-dependent dephospho-CoA kinase family protein [Methanomassiliicoccales archaeon]|jgi:hypothetical protein|nr:GTP-dependent dephospho-CoA kinase family protein [Methanomassiliicoccales archaeon]
MPFGSLLGEEEAMRSLREGELTVTVGDVVSLSMLERGLQPRVMVYDLRNRRRRNARLAARLPSLPGEDMSVENPAGRITPGLVVAIQHALASENKVKMMVEGEEDLASLVIAALAPDGTRLLYGLPGKGIVCVQVDAAVREKARELIDAMEECN